MALLNKGDEVLLPAPYWVSYSAIVTLSEAKFKIIPTSMENGFKITPTQLKSELTSRTKLIMFNSPNNPSGIVYSEKELMNLLKYLKTILPLMFYQMKYMNILFMEKNTLVLPTSLTCSIEL